MLIWRLPTPWARTGRTPPYLVVSLRLCARADVDLLQDLVAACRRAPRAALFELCRLACAAAAGADVRVRVGVAKREGEEGKGCSVLGRMRQIIVGSGARPEFGVRGGTGAECAGRPVNCSGRADDVDKARQAHVVECFFALHESDGGSALCICGATYYLCPQRSDSKDGVRSILLSPLHTTHQSSPSRSSSLLPLESIEEGYLVKPIS